MDSTYYALVSERNVQLWAERTPDDFLFNIKAYALMTQHPAEVSRMPQDLREMLSATERQESQSKRPSPAVLNRAFEMFWSALGPLRQVDKLGLITFQFPPYFIARQKTLIISPAWLNGCRGPLSPLNSVIRARCANQISGPRP